jgi:hypothetical protein
MSTTLVRGASCADARVSCRVLSSIPLQLPLSPTWVFAIAIELANDITVQRPQHAHARMHQQPAVFRRHDESFAAGLLFR